MIYDKHFTVEEANSLLGELTELVRQLQGIRDDLVAAWPEARQVLRAVPTNGGGKEAVPYLAGLSRLNRVIRRLNDLGVILKDLDRGLIDFPHLRNGREVFLCWELGEPAVRYWHDLDSGYAGRQPV